MEYAWLARYLNRKDNFGRLIGAELLEVREGYVKMAAKATKEKLNFLGLPSGAFIFSLANEAVALCVNAHGKAAVGLAMSIQYLASPKVDHYLIAECTEVRLSHKMGFYEVELFDEDGSKVAHCTASSYRTSRLHEIMDDTYNSC